MQLADVYDRDICRGMFVKDLLYFVIHLKFLSYRHKPYIRCLFGRQFM